MGEIAVVVGPMVAFEAIALVPDTDSLGQTLVQKLTKADHATSGLGKVSDGTGFRLTD